MPVGARYNCDMDSTFPILPIEIEAAVAAQRGGPITVPSREGQHVVMSMAAYREMLGIGTDELFDESVRDLKISLAQAAAGETLSVEKVRQAFTDKYGS
jgi:hypothetical protein